MPDLIYLQHEVRPYPGCSKCKGHNYPYYRGTDKKYYCEDCAEGLVKDRVAQFGRHKNIKYCPRCKGTGRIDL